MIPKVGRWVGGLAFVLAVACSGGGEGPALTTDELSDVIPRPAEMGPEFSGFRVTESVRISNEVLAAETDDPAEMIQEARKYGRVDGYRVRITDSAGSTVTMVVSYQRKVSDARDYVKSQTASLRSPDPPPGGSASAFAVNGIGDESFGILMTSEAPPTSILGRTYYETYVLFRNRNVLVTVVVARYDDADMKERAVKVARLLNDRITALLASK